MTYDARVHMDCYSTHGAEFDGCVINDPMCPNTPKKQTAVAEFTANRIGWGATGHWGATGWRADGATSGSIGGPSIEGLLGREVAPGTRVRVTVEVIDDGSWTEFKGGDPQHADEGRKRWTAKRSGCIFCAREVNKKNYGDADEIVRRLEVEMDPETMEVLGTPSHVIYTYMDGITTLEALDDLLERPEWDLPMPLMADPNWAVFGERMEIEHIGQKFVFTHTCFRSKEES